MSSFNIDFAYFYLALAISLGIGVLSAIYKKPIFKIMEDTEEKANGRTAAH